MSESEARCWCGERATHVVRHQLPGASIETPVCDEHKIKTLEAIKWKLVADGTYIPGMLTLEEL